MADRGASCHRFRANSARFLLLSLVAAGCGTAGAARVRMTPPAHATVLTASDRVLVAGFLTESVSDSRGAVDVNVETARLIRMQLRKTLLRVVETEPFRLEARGKREQSQSDAGSVAVSSINSSRADLLDLSDLSDPLFKDLAFWKRMGEEYGQPVILTGSLTFTPAAPRYEERTAGRRTLRVWRPGFRLCGTLVVINGTTGEIEDAVTLHPIVAHATTGRESSLSLYFQLMERAMPSILRLFGQQSGSERILLR